MKTSEIIDRAERLADMTGASTITFQEKTRSLNESWKDVYEKLINSGDDYFTVTVEIPVTNAMKEDENTYRIPLPVEAYKIRTIDAKTSGNRWQIVDKFPLTSRNNMTFGTPYYRFLGHDVWLLVSPSFTASSLRVRYYPQAEALTFPDTPAEFAEAVPAYDKGTISCPFVVDAEKMYYLEDDASIIYEDKAAGTSITAGAGVDISQIAVYKGYLYYIDEGDIRRGALVLPFVSSPVTGYTGLVESFSILEDKIYYFNGTQTHVCNLDGTGDALYLAAEVKNVCKVAGLVAYINAGGTITVNSVDLLISADELATDGTYLFARNGYIVTRYDADGENPEIIALDAAFLGNYSGERLGYKSDAGNLYALSAYPDMELDYPLNIVPEIMSYQSAIDYRRKLEKPSDMIVARLAELWKRFESAFRRDSYKPERIGNFYRARGWNV